MPFFERVRTRKYLPSFGDSAAQATGGVIGVIAGTAIGATAGALGILLGGLAGAIGGWWTGRALAVRRSSRDERGSNESGPRAH